jgi:ABC-2 type transport system ATP-binding protein
VEHSRGATDRAVPASPRPLIPNDATILTAWNGLSKIPIQQEGMDSRAFTAPFSADVRTDTTFVIDVQNITKRYGHHTAIDRVTFSVAKGEVLAFLGPNGAGKTTTMRILTCFMPATEGTARVAGFDCTEHPLEVKRQIGYLPETPPVYQELTVTEYLTFVGRLRGITGQKLTSALDQSIGRLELGSVRGRLIGNLSRGYRQRVGLAQALLHDPPVLILDEPTVGLDPKQIIEIRELIKALAGSHSVILSTHILPEATAVCQRVVIINKGRIVAEDTPEQLSARLRQSEKVSITLKTSPADCEMKLRVISGILNVLPGQAGGSYLIECELGRDVRDEIARVAVANQWGLLELRTVSMTLEDVFLQLTRHEDHLSEPAEATVSTAAAPRTDAGPSGIS